MSPPRTLVAGVGNIFLGDDGFGSEVARRLADGPLPPHVRVVDYGIGGIHLAYDLLDGYDLLVLLDTVRRGGCPGDVAVLHIDPDDESSGLDAHSMDPQAVFASLRALGGTRPRTLLVGCEPEDCRERMGLTLAVAAAVTPAVDAVRELLASGDLTATLPPPTRRA